MAGLFDKQADLYLDARPTYPSEWYSKLAGITLRRDLAWDVGTGNGQAALSIAEHYDRVIATDVSESQLKLAMPNPKVVYHHTPPSMTDDELVDLIGGENSVDLITVAQAVHWFDLPRFYALATRLLRKPSGVIAVWCYSDVVVNQEFDAVLKRFHTETLPFWKYPNIQYLFDAYKTLPFPFEGVGMGSEGEPMELEMPTTTAFEGIVRMLRSWSAVVAAKDKGFDLLSENVVRELETAWGGSRLVRNVVYKAFMLAGRVRV
ncbi:PREDICTED: putative methyltransferase DDB_G0268948 [Tarenaya hassleriana]|uniref:putative methyltransferase DDB_G0268948 n=1 Tax=Tarenaya hassleriana TaxID=28532 RepID=UPI00053C50B7|nr:PREDICTED: putative methyltransferase DDB_G0268948 [Tarenaya hassleriana]